MGFSEEEVDPWEGLEELLEEPPGGLNHGRKRTAGGKWRALEAVDWSHIGDEQKPVPAPLTEDLPSGPGKVPRRKHGTTYTYVVIRCRCQECKTAWAKYMRKRRNGL